MVGPPRLEPPPPWLQAHGPFLYVSVMGVRPDQQGRGLGTSLLAFLCDRADAAGLHCYIEATSPRNQALYERFGFRLLQVCTVAAAGVRSVRGGGPQCGLGAGVPPSGWSRQGYSPKAGKGIPQKPEISKAGDTLACSSLWELQTAHRVRWCAPCRTIPYRTDWHEPLSALSHTHMLWGAPKASSSERLPQASGAVSQLFLCRLGGPILRCRIRTSCRGRRGHL
jgi:hypothetical protein